MSSVFECPDCGRVSHNPNDVREGYCGACHAFTGKGEHATRSWRIVIDKWKSREDHDLETAVYVVDAPTAQQAMRGLTDLTTNNGRVVRAEIRERT